MYTGDPNVQLWSMDWLKSYQHTTRQYHKFDLAQTIPSAITIVNKLLSFFKWRYSSKNDVGSSFLRIFLKLSQEIWINAFCSLIIIPNNSKKMSKSPSTDENNVLQLAPPMGKYDRCSLETPLRHHTDFSLPLSLTLPTSELPHRLSVAQKLEWKWCL